jgi:tetratricopeptide (TPR) repeat protein
LRKILLSGQDIEKPEHQALNNLSKAAIAKKEKSPFVLQLVADILRAPAATLIAALSIFTAFSFTMPCMATNTNNSVPDATTSDQSAGATIPESAEQAGAAAGIDRHSNPHLKDGIVFFKKGNFRESMTEFSMALNSEFSNATLHYYMANALIGMRQRDAAIREFRIAYALAPREQAGTLSRLALSYMGADNYEDGRTRVAAKAKKGLKPNAPPVDPAFERTLQMLKKQSEDASTDAKNMSPQEAESMRLFDENIKKSKTAVVDAIMRADPDDVHLPPEALSHYIRVKQLTEDKNKRHGNIVKKTATVKDSADSLQSLLQEKNSKSAPRLLPHGTNLYIRNYKSREETKNSKP